MKAIFLPKLIKDHRTTKPEAGEWVSEKSIRLLETIPKDLDIQEGDVTGEIINATPTLYAQPWIFAQALFAGPQHPLHHRVKAEWRGLLGLFCFKDLLGIRLTTSPLTIPFDDATTIKE